MVIDYYAIVSPTRKICQFSMCVSSLPDQSIKKINCIQEEVRSFIIINVVNVADVVDVVDMVNVVII